MEEKKINVKQEEVAEAEAKKEHQISETWAQDVIEDIDDFIESQGIYLRQ